MRLDEITADLLAKVRAKVPNPVLYDLGCGQHPAEGFIGVDINGSYGERVDLYAYPWPWADGSVDYFRASHFVEHVPDWDAHFAEVYRCLKVGGYYEILSPYYLNNRWWQDPDHKQPILREKFNYLNRDWRKAVLMDHYGAAVNFSEVGWFELLNDDFRDTGLEDEYVRQAAKHWWNVIDDVAVILRKEPM